MKVCFESSDSSYTLNPAYLEHQPTCEDVTATQDPRTNGFSKGNISEAKSGYKRRVFLRSNGCTIEQSSGPVYTKCQYQCCNNSAMTLAIPVSLKEMVSLQNGLATHFRATSFLPPATKLGQGNIFRSMCQQFCPQGGYVVASGGHAWFYSGGHA